MNIWKSLVNLASGGVKKPDQKRGVILGAKSEPPNLSATATVSTIQAAIRMAEQGDTKDLFTIYRDALLGDEHIQGEFGKRKLAVLAQPLSVQPVDKDSADDDKAAIAVRQAIAECDNWTSGIGSMMDGTLWPVSVTEMVFGPPDPERNDAKLQYTLKRWEPVNPQLLCYKWAYQGRAKVDLEQWEPWLKLWAVDADNKPISDTTKAESLDRDRYVVHRGHLLTGIRDNWGGPFRCILAWWLLRGLGRDWFGRYMERFGSPFPVAKTNTQDAEAVAFLRDAFSVAVKIGGMVIGQDDAVELKEAAMSGGADGHERWHNVCNKAISRAIVGQDLSSTASSTGLGSGVAGMQAGVREDIRMFDQMVLAETLERQFVRRFLTINGLRGRARLVWGGLSDEDAAAFAEVLLKLSQAGLEPDDDAVETTIPKRLGFGVVRKAVAPAFGGFGGAGDGADLARFRASTPGALVSFAIVDPEEAISAERRKALQDAYRGAMAPFRAAILESRSKEECLARLTRLYADWNPKRLQVELETALQICAAVGATRK